MAFKKEQVCVEKSCEERERESSVCLIKRETMYNEKRECVLIKRYCVGWKEWEGECERVVREGIILKSWHWTCERPRKKKRVLFNSGFMTCFTLHFSLKDFKQ